jgi:NAD(P)-dependent dehydrogenase (short-subunit alcohol dehydrogenase family)
VDTAVADAMVAQFGEISALFNNAGPPGPPEPWGEVKEESVRLVLDVNLVGAMITLNPVVSSMRRRGGGAIVNTASTASFKGYGNARPSYIVSKHGVIGLTKEAAVRLAPENIRVNGVAPGVADTPLMHRVHEVLNAESPQSAMREFETVIPNGRYATVDDVAAVVLFLLDERNSHINGTTISVDGGETAE